MKKINRREALKVGAIGAAGLATGAMFLPNKVLAKTAKKAILKTASEKVKSNSALTLIEQAKIAFERDEPLKASVMEILVKSSDLLQYMPFKSISGNAMAFNSSIGHRITEALTIAGGDLDVDACKAPSAGEIDLDFIDFRSKQECTKIKSLGQSLSKTIVNGNSEKDPKVFNGLQVRCKGRQLINNDNGALSLYKLDRLIASVNKPTHLLMNKIMSRRLRIYYHDRKDGDIDRKYRHIDWELDNFGRRVTKYNNLPIMISGKDHENDKILPFTEGDAYGMPQCTSIYCLSFAENGVVGLQHNEMKVHDLGEITTKPVYRTRVEWYVTIALFNTRAAARLQYIKDGPIKA